MSNQAVTGGSQRAGSASGSSEVEHSHTANTQNRMGNEGNEVHWGTQDRLPGLSPLPEPVLPSQSLSDLTVMELQPPPPAFSGGKC